MTTPAPFLGNRDPRRLRPWLIGFTFAILGLALAMNLLWDARPFPAGAALMAAYGLAPLLQVAEVWLLLELLARAVPLVAGGPPWWLVRGAAAAFLASLLAPAIVNAVVCALRVHQRFRLPTSGSYVPEPWHSVLGNLLDSPARHIAQPAMAAIVLVTLWAALRLRPSRVRLGEDQ
jgi:hypothetical protein